MCCWYAYSCSQCGYCVEECDQFYGRGWESQSPRGQMVLAAGIIWKEEPSGLRRRLILFGLYNCELVICAVLRRCPSSLPGMKLRGKLINREKRIAFPPFEK